MKLGLISNSFTFFLPGIVLGLASAGCSGATPPNGLLDLKSDGGVITSNEPPHALAAITLGETHTAGESSSEAIVLASFVPDASLLNACTTTVAGCTIPIPAVCDGVTGPKCQDDQFCALDATCKPTCEASCTVQCPAGQACYFASGNTQSCQPIQTFDGGDLVFSGLGLASAITLFPPSYLFSSTNDGNPLVPGGAIEVTASGSIGAGFAPFQETFTATTLLQTSPSLTLLTPTKVFSPQGLSVGWQPGTDAILISVTGPLGTAQCSAQDSAGAYIVPAQVVTSVAGTGNPSMSIAVTRQRLVEKTDGKTQGTLTGETIEPLGYIDLTTVSTETITVAGCGNGTTETLCSDGCVDTTTSSTDCGTCGHSCGTGYCSEGVCYGTTPSCASPLTSCSGACVNLSTSVANCGDCGFSCPVGDSCVSGTCTTSSVCGTLTSCTDGCQDLLTSTTDCGECGNSCGGATCTNGVCASSATTCSTCETTAESVTCEASYNACADDANCSDYSSCMANCVAGDTSCQETCELDYPNGQSEAENLQTCICTSACASSCSTTTYCTQTL
jgi:hypothetical protein